MLNLFPPIAPYATHKIAVEPPHEIYVEECGNPKGLPVLFVHGGPGVGCKEDHRRFFDPHVYRIILFDQRGAGRSTPQAELKHNNTQALVADMETIRQFLGVNQWLLFGASWGSTLSLVYAQTHPKHVIAMILRGIYLNRHEDAQWLYGEKGARRFFPDHWQEFEKLIPKNYRHDIVLSYYELLTNSNEFTRMAAAKAWSKWEECCAALMPLTSQPEPVENLHLSLAIAQIECHYFINNCFLAPDQILHNMANIQAIPAIIVHGRYDMVCPFDNAWQLHQAWPDSELHILPQAGHSSSDPGMLNALMHATRSMARRFGKP